MPTNENLENIPDTGTFAIEGHQIKKILGILQVIQSRDRNQLFSLYREDIAGMYQEMKDLKEVHLEIRHIDAV